MLTNLVFDVKKDARLTLENREEEEKLSDQEMDDQITDNENLQA